MKVGNTERNKGLFLRLYRKFFKSFVDRFPQLKANLNRIWYSCWKLRLKFNTCFQGIDFDWNKTYWVNPSQIKYALRENFHIYKFKGEILDGNWDLPSNLISFEELDVYQAFCKHFIEGQSWQSTDFYQRVLNRINSGTIKWGCKNREDFEHRLKDLEELYEDIRVCGFKTQEIGSTLRKQEDEIAVVIGRDGDLLFNNGRHRLAIAKILNLEKIPVKVTLRHRRWVDFIKEVKNYLRVNSSASYQPLTHPDLNNLTSRWGEERFQTIRNHLSLKNGTLLDIGANWGYFCHKFEDEGFDCYAVEVSRQHLYFLKKLRSAGGKKFKIIEKSILDYDERTDFDVILALNIFHHLLKTESTYIKLIEFLKRINAKTMFFQPHLYHESQMKEAYKNYTPDEFVGFIQAHSRLKNTEFIGEDKGRPIYKLF